MHNLQTAIDLSDIVRTSLGPMARDKLIVKANGELLITNDGRTLLEEMQIKHPIGRLLVNLSKNQDANVGDGTTSVVVFCGRLCSEALKLRQKGYHPLEIINGYKIALKHALIELRNLQIVEYKKEHFKKELCRAAKTSLNSKMVNRDRDRLAQLCVDAVLLTCNDERRDCNLNLIKLDYKENGTLEQTKLYHGIVLEKSFSSENMLKMKKDVKIAVLSCPLEPPRPKTKHFVNITTPEQYQQLKKLQENYYNNIFSQFQKFGVNAIICQWGIDNEVNQWLACNQCIAVSWVSGDDLERVAMACGATICPRIEELSEKMLGYAESISEQVIENSSIVVIEGCKNPKACSILVRGSNKLMCEDTIRSLYDAICNVRNTIVDSGVVAGGGAIEIELYTKLQQWISKESILQESVKSWIESLLVIPSTLAENAGLNPIETVFQLISKHKQGRKFFGIEYKKEVKLQDITDVFENIRVKESIYKLATEMVSMILKIDNIIYTHD